MTEPVIDIRDARKVYATGAAAVEALRGVSLRVEHGEYIAVMGPSGSGKSTLMHILGCLDVPTSGSYTLAGADVSRLGEAELAAIRNQRIGFVFQQFHLLAGLPAWRNVELPLCYAGVRRAERRTRASEMLATLGLADRAEHRPGELSGGQQSRVALARALVTRPSIVLADEPTGALDSAATAEVLQVLAGLHRQGNTIVLITHEEDVAEHAHRVVRLRDGRIASDTAAVGAGAAR
jgi:putative ABC transport system ATP-binding protein